MRRLAWFAVFLLLLVVRPATPQQPETGAQKAENSQGNTEHGSMVVWGWINFVLLAAGLGYLAKKNAGPYFAKRSLAIRQNMIDADVARAESDAKVAEVDARLANLEGEIEALQSNARQEAEADAERIRQETGAEMAKIQARIAEEIASATKSARLELRRYSAGLALDLAERKIAARMSPEVQDRLVDHFAAAMADSAPGARDN